MSTSKCFFPERLKAFLLMYQFIAYDTNAPLPRQSTSSSESLYTVNKLNNWLLQTPGWQTANSGIPVSGQTHRKKTLVIHLKIGAWDVRTLIDSTGQIDHSVEHLLLGGNSAVTKYSSPECDSHCRSRKDQRS